MFAPGVFDGHASCDDGCASHSQHWNNTRSGCAMSRSFSVVFAVVLLSALCVGQSPERQPSGRVDVFGGFSFVPQDFSLTNPDGGHLFGWNASATFPQPHHLGVVADVSGYYPSFNYGCGSGCAQSAKIHSFLFGPQVSVTRGRLKPFARFLLGDTYISTDLKVFTSSNSLTFGAGGGVDISLSHRFALREQVDWLHNRFQTSDNQRYNEEHRNVARLSTGLVIRF